jgi:RNA polymerase sigma factor (TIGR02999 family)
MLVQKSVKIVEKKSDEAARLRDLVQALYPELRRLAKRKLSGERKGHTLQPTALTNEVVVRLLRRELSREDPQAILWAGITEMRRLLIDYGRKWQVRKKYLEGLSDEDTIGNVEDAVHLELLLDQLEIVDARARKVVELRYLLGLDMKECAALMGLSMRTIGEDLEFAKGWLGLHWGKQT